MKITELRKKSKSELDKLLLGFKKRLRVLYFDLAAGKVKNVREVRKIKRDIARILTILNESKINTSASNESKNKKEQKIV